ncbi:asparaginase [Micrococcales bacterium 31B]|nr:asparaginase [Micrococcales bacterium 31B]
MHETPQTAPSPRLSPVTGENRPRLAVLTTGGTIAGRTSEDSRPGSYEAGVLSASDLLDSVPGLGNLADLELRPVFSLDSSSLTPEHWLELLRETLAAVRDPHLTGIVITHGTDSLEETALFLAAALSELAGARHSPVVLVGSMRPANAISAEGPANLLAAATLATHPAASGVMVVLNDSIFDPWSVTKAHTSRVDAFTGGERGLLGHVAAGRAVLYREGGHAELAAVLAKARAHAGRPLPQAVPARLGRVPLLTLHVGFDPGLLGVLGADADGLVLAGFGGGNLGAEALEAASALAATIPVVRGTRVSAGEVVENGLIDDDAAHFLILGDLSAVKARALLSWVLASD